MTLVATHLDQRSRRSVRLIDCPDRLDFMVCVSRGESRTIKNAKCPGQAFMVFE